jgi:FMN reductase
MSALLGEVAEYLDRVPVPVRSIIVRALPAEDLVLGRADSIPIRAAAEAIDRASGVAIATPVYRAAASGLLKTFLDLLGRDALRHKVVLPIAVGGSPAHLLAIDYSLRPVLAALGATHVLQTIYATDAQVRLAHGARPDIDVEIRARLREAASVLARAVTPGRAHPTGTRTPWVAEPRAPA